MKYLTLSTDCGTIKVSISTGSILFLSNPPGADIYLIVSGGGPPVNTTLQTPNPISPLPIGNYDYILKLEGFEDYNGTATVNANELSTVNVDLIPIAKISPLLAATGASLFGLLLLASSRSAIAITTGKLGGEIVAVKF